MEPGERVLIHAASGGVGIAAIRVAQRLGAEILATAGSEEKRAYVRSLGVRHVFDSRSLRFVEAVREATGDEGVDVVLNSLAGAFIPAGLSLLRPFGRFVEIGRRDIHENAALHLKPFANDLSFHAVDLTTLLAARPARARPPDRGRPARPGGRLAAAGSRSRPSPSPGRGTPSARWPRPGISAALPSTSTSPAPSGTPNPNAPPCCAPTQPT